VAEDAGKDIVIRRATEADAAAVAGICWEAFPESTDYIWFRDRQGAGAGKGTDTDEGACAGAGQDEGADSDRAVCAVADRESGRRRALERVLAFLLGHCDNAWVAESEGEVVGFVLAPRHPGKVMTDVLRTGLAARLLGGVLTGRVGLAWGRMGGFFVDKVRTAFRAMGRRDWGEIMMLAIDERARGRGVGRRLLARALQELECRGAPGVRIEALDGNPASLKLYRGAGFEIAGRFQDSRGSWLVLERPIGPRCDG